MKVRRIKFKIIEILNQEGDLCTDEIYSFVQRISYHGCTMNQLSNVLAKAKEIDKKGFVDFYQNGFRRRSAVWGLKEEIQ
jgi:hypothetical protein